MCESLDTVANYASEYPKENQIFRGLSTVSYRVSRAKRNVYKVSEKCSSLKGVILEVI